MEKIEYLETDNGKVSIQAHCPKIINREYPDGKIQPMELSIVVENDKGKYEIYNFNKDQCPELMEQMKRAVELVNCFG